MRTILDSTTTLSLYGYAIRVIVVYLALLIAVRIMGKQQIAELTPYDFLIAVLFGSLAGLPLVEAKVGVNHTLISMATLTFWQVGLAFLALKVPFVGRLIQGGPLVVVQDGKIIKKNLLRGRYTIDDLLSLLRIKGAPDIADVEFAILESNGQVSVIKKSQARPVTPADLGLPTEYVGIPTVLVEDGQVLYENLVKVHLDMTWLNERLRAFGIQDVNQVFLASLDTSGKLFIETTHQAEEAAP